MKNKKIRYRSLIIFVSLALLIGINMDKIRFGIGILDIYRKTPSKSTSSTRDKESNPPSPVENPLEKILVEVEPVDKGLPSGDIKDSIESSGEDFAEERIIEAPKNNNEEVLNPNANNNSTQSPPENLKVIRSLKSITEEYNKEFIALQSEFEKTLSNMVNLAYEEYKSGQYSNSKLADIYLEKGVALEKSADSKFYGLLKSYENELKENSHDTSIVKEVKIYYESFKKERKSEIITKSMEMVKK